MIGNKIYERRKQINLSQEKLAEKIHVSRQTISNWENNLTIPDLYQAKALVDVLKLENIDALLDVTNDSFQSSKIDWNRFTEVLKEKVSCEINAVSYNAWFKELCFSNYNNGTITFSVPMEIHKKIIEDKYNSLLIELVDKITNKKFKIEYIVKS